MTVELYLTPEVMKVLADVKKLNNQNRAEYYVWCGILALHGHKIPMSMPSVQNPHVNRFILNYY